MKQVYMLTLGLVLLLAACSKEGKLSNSQNNAGGKGGSLARFAISGGYLYVANNKTLQTFDISNDGSPVLKDSVDIGWGIETIFAYDSKLFIGSTSAMYIYSLDNPAKPVKESQSQHFRACDPVVSAGTTAYVTLRGGSPCGGMISGLMVYDVTDIKNPALVKSIPLTSPYGLGIQDSVLYVCDGTHGLALFNIKDAHNPKRISTIDADDAMYMDVIPYNDVLIAYIDGGVKFFDITKPDDPVALSTLGNE